MTEGAPLTDYGRYHRAAGQHLQVAPTTLEEAQEIFLDVNRHQKPVRIRGCGHSMNGSAVPQRDEIMILSSGFSHFQFDEHLTVTVGAGAAVWDVDQMLRTHGFELLLLNDGGAAASSVGGFASAGGIGAETWRYGGFWETVAEIKFVAGSGEFTLSRPGDELFPWIFGSMGQLGLIVEVKLRIRRCDDQLLAVYPKGLAGRVPKSAPAWENNVWLTLLVPEEACERAAAQLEDLGKRYRNVWMPRGGYAYFVRFHNFNPPLIYPLQESFVAVGVWGMTSASVEDLDFPGLQALESEFAGLVPKEPTYRRYVQSELTFEHFDFAHYFGPEVFEGFRKWKLTCDPRFLLGRGSVFS